MKELQELKTWFESQKAEAEQDRDREAGFDREEWNMFNGMVQAFALCIEKVELILQAQPL